MPDFTPPTPSDDMKKHIEAFEAANPNSRLIPAAGAAHVVKMAYRDTGSKKKARAALMFVREGAVLEVVKHQAIVAGYAAILLDIDGEGEDELRGLPDDEAAETEEGEV